MTSKQCGAASSSQGTSVSQQDGIPNYLKGESLLKLATHLGRDGWDLGLVLKFEDGELQIFKMNNKDDKQEETRSMLAEYIKRTAKGDVLGGLLGGLRAIGRNDLCIKLQKAAEDEGDFK